MLHKLRQRAQDEQGFTLIELLVVILIIGILAAIAIPSFLNQRTKATDSAAKSAVRTAQTAMETYFTDSQTYAGATPTILAGIEPTLTDVGTRLSVVAANQNDYQVQVYSERNGNNTVRFNITRSDTGLTTRSCAYGTANAGGCRGTSW